MRVLHVYSGNLYGGIETLLATLWRQRNRCPSMEPAFALCFRGRLSRELEADGAALHWLGEVRVRHPLSVWHARRRLRALLRAGSFDVVVCHAAWSQAIFGRTVRAARRPLVDWQHTAADGGHWLDRWARTTVPDLVLCNSEFTASRCHPGLAHVPTEVIYCPVEASHPGLDEVGRHELRSELKTAPDAIVIIQVGRVERLKGHLLHLKALARLRDLPGWLCWQVGDPQRRKETGYWEDVKRAAMQLGISDRVHFLGQRSDVRRLLTAADIYCQPNVEPDSFGLAFIEALYAGLPLVTTAIGGACEIVDGSCGVLVPPGDIDRLATGLRQLVTDAGLRRRLGASGPARALRLCEPATQMKRLRDALVRTSAHCSTPSRRSALNSERR